MALNEDAQSWDDDLRTWGDLFAKVEMIDPNGGPATDFQLSPGEVKVMFTALRDHAQNH